MHLFLSPTRAPNIFFLGRNHFFSLRFCSFTDGFEIGVGSMLGEYYLEVIPKIQHKKLWAAPHVGASNKNRENTVMSLLVGMTGEERRSPTACAMSSGAWRRSTVRTRAPWTRATTCARGTRATRRGGSGGTLYPRLRCYQRVDPQL